MGKMLDKIIIMELLSDICPASGEGFAGFVDTDVCFDDFGLPYIPAKRLKGVLREHGLDILSVDESYSGVFDKLFGETGKLTPGTLHISNGRLKNYNGIVREIAQAHRSELAEVYTSVRSRTKMEGGKAAPGALRALRVLNRKQVFEFPVTLSEDTLELFQMCVKSLRSMGLNRSRGLGEVKCALVDAAPRSGVHFSPVNNGKNENPARFSYALELLEPVIIADRTGKPLNTEGYIFGSAILGALAVKYIEKHGLPREKAYEDEDFRKIFLDGGVTFTAAFGYKDGNVYYPAPAVLKTDKLGVRLSDGSNGITEEANENNPICKRLGGFISVKDGKISTFRPEKTSFAHHARPDDKSKGHATADAGEFFTYEALSAGQLFAGSIIGGSAYVEALAGLFSDGDILRIGRSRTAQYGRVRIAPLDFGARHAGLSLISGKKYRLIAVTPIILEDSNGINVMDVKTLTDTLGLGEGLEILKFVCSETTAAGYNGKWLLPRAQERAFAEGSTIVFKYSGEDTTLYKEFVGKRTGEGFGQIRLEPVPEADGFTFECETDNTNMPEAVILPAIAALRTEKEAVSKGARYGEDLKNPPRNANLQRVITALGISGDFKRFAELLCGIKQPEQKTSALAFAARQDKWYFKTDAKRLTAGHIVGLLKSVEYEYADYKKFLNAAAQRIKQKRRNGSGGKSGNGGENNA
jgi:CRISPR-associated protein Csx10